MVSWQRVRCRNSLWKRSIGCFRGIHELNEPRQKLNYVLISAIDGKEAVDKAREEKPDLILMDIVMPRMTGLEACRVLKSDKETERIPVILLTTRGEEKYVQEGYASGCSDYLTKPVNDAELLDLLKAYLGE